MSGFDIKAELEDVELVPEYMREWEYRLTLTQRRRALEIAEENGYQPGDVVSVRTWAAFFQQAENECPRNARSGVREQGSD